MVTWANQLRSKLIDMRGNRCENCGISGDKTQLEWHHLKPTGLSGRSRGSTQRAIDVRDNPGSYGLFCRRCHMERHGIEEERRDRVYKAKLAGLTKLGVYKAKLYNFTTKSFY